jgi:hypothetical protein
MTPEELERAAGKQASDLFVYQRDHWDRKVSALLDTHLIRELTANDLRNWILHHGDQLRDPDRSAEPEAESERGYFAGSARLETRIRPSSRLETVLFAEADDPPRDPDGWLKSWAFVARRKDREAIFGDLIEDRIDMRERGYRRVTIDTQTLWQLFLIVALRLGKKLSLLAAAAWVYRKLSS